MKRGVLHVEQGGLPGLTDLLPFPLSVKPTDEGHAVRMLSPPPNTCSRDGSVLRVTLNADEIEMLQCSGTSCRA